MPITRDVSNSADIVDSRDIIARIDELESLFATVEISEDNGATTQPLGDGTDAIKAVETTCGECGRTWNDALITSRTPAPSARCPYEAIHEELAELRVLKLLQEDAEGYCDDWHHGAALIRDSYFEEYARQFADDIGAINRDARWPTTHIDWKAAAEDLQQDYTSVDWDGVTYWVR